MTAEAVQQNTGAESADHGENADQGRHAGRVHLVRPAVGENGDEMHHHPQGRECEETAGHQQFVQGRGAQSLGQGKPRKFSGSGRGIEALAMALVVGAPEAEQEHRKDQGEPAAG